MTILFGDCRATLCTLEPDSIQTCVTSPPYWGLRDYGTATWEGGAEDCEHLAPMPGGTASSGLYAPDVLNPDVVAEKVTKQRKQWQGTCRDCGARRIDSQLGLEETPDAYVAGMVEVFREVRRVLRPDGTLWLNLGDSYAATTKGSGGPASSSTLAGTPAQGNGQRFEPRRVDIGSLKPKDLCGIPWRVAFALQADGWWLRSDIIWSKPNPMPESVTDRPTKAHEYVFLLSKSASYFYDAKAIAEPALQPEGDARQTSQHKQAALERSLRASTLGTNAGPGTRNARSVWSIASEPYDGAHFAVMPSALAARCILAGSRMGDAVLDPFMGSGTVGMVAEELGRQWVGCELNPEFEKLIRQRTAQRGLFGQVGT